MNIRKKTYIVYLFLSIFIITLLSSKLYYGSLSVEGLPTAKGEKNETYVEEYSACLSDLYDTSGYNLDKYLDRKETLQELISMYDELNNADDFEYYQFSDQSVCLNGRYRGPVSAVLGDENVINQTNISSGELFTPVSSTNISRNMIYQLDGNVYEGKGFTNEDYNHTYEDIIPVILGNDYSELYNVGDKIKATFFLADIEFEIIGILKDDVAIGPPKFGTEIDNYIILPVINIPNEHKSEMLFNDKIVMLEQCEGYISVTNINNYQSAIDELKSITEKYNFAMNIENVIAGFEYQKSNYSDNTVKAEEDDTISFSNEISGNQKIWYCSLLALGEVLFLVSIGLFIRINTKDINRKKKLVFYCTEKVIVLILIVSIFYTIAYEICIQIMKHSYEMFEVRYILYPQSIVRLELILVLVIACIVLCTKAKKIYEEADKDV